MRKARKQISFSKIIWTLVIVGMVFASASGFNKRSDSYIRNRVVKLEGERAMCTGEQVTAPSGIEYILSAGHCKDLAIGGMIRVVTEDGMRYDRKVIAEDPKSDLLLIQGIEGLSGLQIAKADYPHEQVRAFTHGKNLDTWQTAGELIQIQDEKIPIGPAGEVDCTMPKDSIEMVVTPFGTFSICCLHVQEVVSTLSIVPGSSGGPIVDSSGKVVAVASAVDEHFSYLVPLADITAFLAGR